MDGSRQDHAGAGSPSFYAGISGSGQGSFDFLGITIQFEMCYTNILQILELSHIPLHSSDRTLEDPFVIGGGPCTYNPEPLAEFFDLFYIGEGETVYDAIAGCSTKNGKSVADPEPNFWNVPHRSREFMYRLFMRPNITRTAL